MINLSSVLSTLVRSEKVRLNWLSSAEVSFTPAAPRKVGVSFFFAQESEWPAFQSVMDIPPQVVEQENALRGSFEFVTRRWIKLHFDGATRSGISQYLQVHPSLHYPLTTLRQALKRCGAADTGFLRDAFEPALQRDDSLWAVILKHNRSSEAEAQPRLSVYVDRTLLPTLLRNLVEAGRLNTETAAGFGMVDARMKAGAYAYLSLDFSDQSGVSVDYEEVAPESVPSDVRPDTPRYLKCRFVSEQREPLWSWYAPLPSLMTERDVLRLRHWRKSGDFGAAAMPVPDSGCGDDAVARRRKESEEAVNQARAYYDNEADNIVRWGGATYQAGTFPNRKPEETNQEWAKRAGIQAGERILDAGCGAGGPVVDMAKAVAGTAWDAVTVSGEQARHARRLVEEAGLGERVRVSVADYHALPFPTAAFNRAVFLESIGYSRRLTQLFREMRRVLKPGGTLFLKDVFQPDRDLTAAEWLELSEFDHVYQQQTPTLSETLAALDDAGFISVTTENLTDVLTTDLFYRGMFEEPKGALAIELGLRPAPTTLGPLTPFGQRHFRDYKKLPLEFWQVKAVRP